MKTAERLTSRELWVAWSVLSARQLRTVKWSTVDDLTVCARGMRTRPRTRSISTTRRTSTRRVMRRKKAGNDRASRMGRLSRTRNTTEYTEACVCAQRTDGKHHAETKHVLPTLVVVPFHLLLSARVGSASREGRAEKDSIPRTQQQCGSCDSFK